MTRLTADATASGPGEPVVLRVYADGEPGSSLTEAFTGSLSGEPTLVVLDFADVKHVGDDALAELRPLADRASAWPGVPVAVTGLSPELAAVLGAAGLTEYVEVHPTVEAALTEQRIHLDDDLPRVKLGLPPSVSAASTARRLVDQALHEWGLPNLRDTARLIVTELVSNAVRHATTPLEVTITCAGAALHICVRDHSSAHPRRGAPVPPTVEGGRGLIVVDLMSRAWGTTPTRDGKAVWASLAVA